MLPTKEILRKMFRDRTFLDSISWVRPSGREVAGAVPVVNNQETLEISYSLPQNPHTFVLVQSLDQIPDSRRVLNTLGGPIANGAAFRHVALALEVADKKAIILLNGDVAQDSHEYRSLCGLLRHEYYIVENTYVAPQYIFENFLRLVKTEGVAKVAATMTDSEQATKSAASVGLVASKRDSLALSDYAAQNSAPSITTFFKIIEKGISLGASDVHICIREKGAKVLMRIFGSIEQVMSLSREDALEAVGVAYNKLAGENSRSRTAHQFNPRDKQYCTIETSVAKQRWRIRYQSTNVEGGLDVVLRLLPSDLIAESKPLSSLGYSPSQCDQLRLGLMRSVGAIFMAGGTGSGKSTTLKTLVTMDPKRANLKWYSVEDPVEYRITKVSQIPVQRDTSDEDSLPFVEAFRALMRMDPDSILIGEIRDKETADLFSAAVMSGHRCVTTLHASSAIGIASRLCSEPILMPRPVLAAKGFISLLVYQTLLPELCPHCRRPASQICESDYLNYIADKFSVDVSGVHVSSGQTCGQPNCRNGIIGRTVAAEIVTPSIQMRALLQEGKDFEMERQWRQTRNAGFDQEDMTGKTAFEHGLYKCLQGQVDPYDLENAFESFRTYEVV
jgi:type II secretory ATPase GspE/PulE/Tfp pilus assembly ATPase PilB-like protein